MDALPRGFLPGSPFQEEGHNAFPTDYTMAGTRQGLIPAITLFGATSKFGRNLVGRMGKEAVRNGSKWGMFLVSPRAASADLARGIFRQGAYHLLLRNHGEKIERIDTICGGAIGALEAGRVIDQLAHNTELAVITLKPAGYCLKDDKAGGFVIDETQLTGDIAAIVDERWDEIKTVPGQLVAGLWKRLQHYSGTRAAYSVMPCENMASNGSVAARVTWHIVTKMRELAEQRGMELSVHDRFVDYIGRKERRIFINTVVDSITPDPKYRPESQYLAEAYAIVDNYPIVAEPYYRCVAENRGYIPEHVQKFLKQAGAVFVPNIKPFEQLKMEELNGRHVLIGLYGKLCGIDYVHAVENDPLLSASLRALSDETALALKREYSGPDAPAGYADHVDEFVSDMGRRLANHNEITHDGHANYGITDETSRLAKGTIGKIKIRFGIGHIQKDSETPFEARAFAVAAWLRFARKGEGSNQGYDVYGNDYDIEGADLSQVGLDDHRAPGFKNNLHHYLFGVGLENSAATNHTRNFVNTICYHLALIDGDTPTPTRGNDDISLFRAISAIFVENPRRAVVLPPGHLEVPAGAGG